MEREKNWDEDVMRPNGRMAEGGNGVGDGVRDELNSV
jgi:hypothetical protein